MKLAIMILVLAFGINLSAREKFKPFQRNEVSKAHAKQLEVLNGYPKKKYISEEFNTYIRVDPGQVVHRYYFKGNNMCEMIFYYNAKDIVYDVSVSSEYCFGKHELQ